MRGAGVAGAAALAGPAALTGSVAASEDRRPNPLPKPIPGGLDIPGIGVIHIFLPGPEDVTLPFSGLQLMGLNVEPSTITDFRGFTALAYLTGKATGSDGASYNFESDFRVFRGRYVAQDGSTGVGTFGLIWVDLFEPGTGSQVHDINGGIPPNGLFWTVDLAQASLGVSRDGRRAVAHVKDLHAIDTFQIFGPSDTPASIDFRVQMRATGPAMRLGSGSEVPPTDPAAFLGRFFPATATGRYSGGEIGFAFRTDGVVTPTGTFAEMGFERNGVFL